MPRVKKEVEEQIDVKQPVKKETVATRWFDDYAVNNKEEMKIICDLTARAAEEQFCMVLKTGNTEVYGMVFYATFMAILDFIKSKQKTYNNFTMEIGNSINIGYTNNDDENNEKVGNFMPILEYIGINRTIIDDSDEMEADRTSQQFIRWKEINVKKNIEYMKEIQERAYEKLRSEYKTSLRTSEAIIPLFCVFMDNISNVLKMKFKEAKDTDVSEVSMNVLGLFDAYYSYNEEDDVEIIDFSPSISVKLALKNDSIAYRE